jgi:predicted kinase
MTQTILVLQGLPASGKSTFARGLVASDPGAWVRVNKDDIRERLLPTGWSKHKEREVVIPERDRLVADALVDGKSAIVDDTNFEDKHIRRMYEIARPFGARVEVKRFDVEVEEAIARDSRRARPVGEAVIRDMARRFIGTPWELEPYRETPGLPWAVLCDLDGTVALFCQRHGCGCGLNHRSPYNAATAHLDTPNAPVLLLLESLLCAAAPDIIFMSGREDLYRRQTVDFLEKHFGHHYELHMRKGGDSRKDAVVKAELFDAHVRGKFNVHFVLDDRNQVVELWRSLGLTCLQVAEGNF